MLGHKPTKNRKRETSFEVDVAMLHAGTGKLTLREAGELIRALARAKSARRPNRDQRMLLAVFTRNPDGEVAI
jgi:hypothetical protein